MSDAVELGLHVGGSRDIAVGEMTEIELDAGVEAPFERDLVDRPGALALVHRWMVVPWRIEMRPVVGRKGDPLDRPPLPVRQVLLLEAREKWQDLRQALLMIDVLDLRPEARRVGRDVVLQRGGDVDEAAGHGFPPDLLLTVRHCERSGAHNARRAATIRLLRPPPSSGPAYPRNATSTLAEHRIAEDADPVDDELDRVAVSRKRPISRPQQFPTVPEPKNSPAWIVSSCEA